VAETREEFQDGTLAKTSLWIEASQAVNEADERCNATPQACIDKMRAFRRKERYNHTEHGFDNLVRDMLEVQGHEVDSVPPGEAVLTAQQHFILDQAKRDAQNAKRREARYKNKVGALLSSVSPGEESKQVHEKLIHITDKFRASAHQISMEDNDNGDPDEVADELGNIMKMSESNRHKLLQALLDQEARKTEPNEYKNASLLLQGSQNLRRLGHTNLLENLAETANRRPEFIEKNPLFLHATKAWSDQLVNIKSGSSKGNRWQKQHSAFTNWSRAVWIQGGGGNPALLLNGSRNRDRARGDNRVRGRKCQVASSKVNLPGPSTRTLQRIQKKENEQNGTVGVDALAIQHVVEGVKQVSETMQVDEQEVYVVVGMDKSQFNHGNPGAIASRSHAYSFACRNLN
jgi:hypothetical protein